MIFSAHHCTGRFESGQGAASLAASATGRPFKSSVQIPGAVFSMFGEKQPAHCNSASVAQASWISERILKIISGQRARDWVEVCPGATPATRAAAVIWQTLL